MIYKLFLASSIMILNIYLYQRYIKRYIIDKPNLRSSHKKPIPTGAGITFAISFTIIAILEGKFIYLICLPLSLIGLIDDIKGLPSILRYLAQLIFAYFLIINANFNLISLKDNFLSFIVIIFLMFLITAIINFFNFLDGLDGLVAGCSLIFFLFFGLNNNSLMLIFSAILGIFLYFNWHPAKFFMGDSGSLYLGSIVALSISQLNNINTSFNLLITLFPLFIDSIICVIRRFFYNENIFKAHKLHTYQRLNQAGLSHSNVSLIYIFAVAELSIAFHFFNPFILYLSIAIQFIIYLYLDNFIAISFEKALNKLKT